MPQTPSRQPVLRQPAAIALLLAASLTTMANATISPALPGLRDLFAGTPGVELLTRLLVPAPSIAVIPVAPLIGLAADRIGRRRLLIAGILLFAIAGSAGMVAPTLPALIASRLVLGLAVAAIMTTQTALVSDLFEGEARQALTGLQVSARNFGGLIFISAAGLLATLSPRLPFAVYALAAAFLPVIWAGLREPRRHSSPPPSASLSGGGDPGIWLPIFLSLAALQLATNLIFFVVPTQLPFFLDARGTGGAGRTGLALACLMLAGGVTALVYARLRARIGHAGAFGFGYLAMGAGFATLAFGRSAALILTATALIGIGYALVTPNFVALALNRTPAARAGTVGGILTTSVFAGQIASPFASQVLIGGFGYGGAFLTIAGLLAAMVLGVAIWVALAAIRPAPLPANSSRLR